MGTPIRPGSPLSGRPLLLRSLNTRPCTRPTTGVPVGVEVGVGVREAVGVIVGVGVAVAIGVSAKSTMWTVPPWMVTGRVLLAGSEV